MTELLDQALAYAARGWNVFPLHSARDDGSCSCGKECASPAKHPRTGHGLKDATTDESQIRHWWQRWPTANIAVVTGAESDLVVVDVDPDHGGEDTLELLEQAHGALAGGRALTGGDGMHIFYAHPGGDVPNTASKIGPGIDTRGDGGYVVAAPSRHVSGNRYEWVTLPDDLPEPPAWLLDLLRKEPPARAATPPLPRTTTEGGTAYGLAALDRELLDLATAVEGNRNNTLVKVAMQLFELVNGGELEEALVLDRLQGTAAALGLGAAEIDTTLNSARARTAGYARTAPPRPDGQASGPRARTRPVPNEPPDGYDEPPGPPPVGESTPDPDDDAGPEIENETDLGNAKRLVAQHEQEIRYVPQWGAWLIWDGQRWARDNTGEIDRRAKHTVRSILTEAALEPDRADRERRAKFALRSEHRSRLEAMVALARTEPAMPVEPHGLDADPWVLNCKNGTLDLRTGELRAHRQTDHITKLSPIVYDPDATHPLWDRFLNDATGADLELQAFLARAVGYSLTGSTAEEVLFFVHGPAASGKSTFIDSIEMAIGDYSRRADFETFLARGQGNGGARGDIARLAGARFVNSVEVDEGAKLAEGLVKTLTGGDMITARFLYKDEFEFRPQFKLWLAANHAPRVKHGDMALWRRILRIPFEHQVPLAARDPRLKAALRDPHQGGPAVLAWAVRGCLEWQQIGLAAPGVITDATEQYRADMDPLGDFLADRCIFGTERWVSSELLRKEYAAWTRENGIRYPISNKEFGETLRDHGCTKTRKRSGSNTMHVWEGVGILSPTDDMQQSLDTPGGDIPITDTGWDL